MKPQTVVVIVDDKFYRDEMQIPKIVIALFCLMVVILLSIDIYQMHVITTQRDWIVRAMDVMAGVKDLLQRCTFTPGDYLISR